jgi:hypothetical protein
MQYLLSVIDDPADFATPQGDGTADFATPQGDGTAGSAAPQEMNAIDVFNERLVADGHWVFGGGLGVPDSATVIDNRGAEAVVADGPFAESKEYLGGLWIVEAPGLDVALKLAAEGSKSCNRKVEVRPFLSE